MGFFTWTLANKPVKLLKSGDYAASCKLKYDGYGAVVCPDGTLIKEHCYEGYGIFNGKDVYDLVVDWNKQHLTDIPNLPCFQHDHRPEDDAAYIAALTAYQKDDDIGLTKAIRIMFRNMSPSITRDWKRWLGIYIACGENNLLIPYPIKIVDCKNPRPYDALPPSRSTQ